MSEYEKKNSTMISEEDKKNTLAYAMKVASGETDPVESMGRNVALCVLHQMVALFDPDDTEENDENLAAIGAIAWLAITERSTGTSWQSAFCKLLAYSSTWPTTFTERNAHHN